MADPLDEVVVKTYFKSGSEISPICQDIGLYFKTPQRDSPVKSTFKETEILGGTVHVSHTDTTTNFDESPLTTIHARTFVIPLKILITDSISKEFRTSCITVYITNMDTNVNMVEGLKQSEAPSISFTETSFIYTSLILSSTIETTLIDTSTS